MMFYFSTTLSNGMINVAICQLVSDTNKVSFPNGNLVQTRKFSNNFRLAVCSHWWMVILVICTCLPWSLACGVLQCLCLFRQDLYCSPSLPLYLPDLTPAHVVTHITSPWRKEKLEMGQHNHQMQARIKCKPSRTAFMSWRVVVGCNTWHLLHSKMQRLVIPSSQVVYTISLICSLFQEERFRWPVLHAALQWWELCCVAVWTF